MGGGIIKKTCELLKSTISRNKETVFMGMIVMDTVLIYIATVGKHHFIGLRGRRGSFQSSIIQGDGHYNGDVLDSNTNKQLVWRYRSIPYCPYRGCQITSPPVVSGEFFGQEKPRGEEVI